MGLSAYVLQQNVICLDEFMQWLENRGCPLYNSGCCIAAQQDWFTQEVREATIKAFLEQRTGKE